MRLLTLIAYLIVLTAGVSAQTSKSNWIVTRIETTQDPKTPNRVVLAKIPQVIGLQGWVFLSDDDLSAFGIMLDEPSPAATVGRLLELDDKLPLQLAVASLIFHSRHPNYVRAQASDIYKIATIAIIRGRCPDFSKQDPILVYRYFQLGQDQNPRWIMKFVNGIKLLGLGQLKVSGSRYDEAISLAVTGPNIQVRLWLGPPAAEAFSCDA